jgi:hypothetical protein
MYAHKLAHSTSAAGLAHTRSSSTLVSLDLLDQTAVEKFFLSQKPDFVIHCAAERRPDAAAADEAKATKLNAEVPAQLAKLSVALGFRLVYISTDCTWKHLPVLFIVVLADSAATSTRTDVFDGNRSDLILPSESSFTQLMNSLIAVPPTSPQMLPTLSTSTATPNERVNLPS